MIDFLIGQTYPVAFFFEVKFAWEIVDLIGFKEVSGLSAEREYETIREGGSNNNEIRLPKHIKHGNLIMKRAVLPSAHPFAVWVKCALELDLAKPVLPQDMIVTLLNEKRLPLHNWYCTDAYPVKWSVDSFASDKNELAIESIELAYRKLIRI